MFKTLCAQTECSTQKYRLRPVATSCPDSTGQTPRAKKQRGGGTRHKNLLTNPGHQNRQLQTSIFYHNTCIKFTASKNKTINANNSCSVMSEVNTLSVTKIQ